MAEGSFVTRYVSKSLFTNEDNFVFSRDAFSFISYFEIDKLTVRGRGL